MSTSDVSFEQPYLAALDKISKLHKVVFSDTAVAPPVAVHSLSTILALKKQFKDGSFNTRSLEVALLNIIAHTFPTAIQQSLSQQYTSHNASETSAFITKQLTSSSYSAAPDLTLAFYRFSTIDPTSVVGRQLHNQLSCALRTAPILSSFDIATMFFSLHRMGPTTLEVEETLYHLLRQLKECEDEFSPRLVAMMLFGCRGLFIDSRRTRKIFYELKQKLYALKTGMSGPEVVMSFLGLQGSGSHFLETRGVLSVLTTRMQYPHPDAAIDISLLPGLLIGLQKMSSEHVWVRGALQNVAMKIEAFMLKQSAATTTSKLPPTLLARMFESMQHFNSKHDETCLLLSQVLQFARDYVSGPYAASDVSRMMLGLQSMQITPGTLPFIQYIQSHVDVLDRLTVSHLGKCLYGLQRMSSSEPTVASLVSSVLQRTPLETYQGHVQLSTFTYMMHGAMLMDFQHITELEAHVRALCNTATDIINTYTTQLKQKKTATETPDNIKSLRQVLLLYSMMYEELHVPADLRQMLNALEMQLKKAHSLTKATPIPSKTENEMIKMFETRFHLIRKAANTTSPFTVSKHKLLFGFDSDLVFSERQVKNKDGVTKPSRIINIEIDGPHHMYTHRKRYATLRDKYLREVRGVKVVRIPIPKHKDWSEKQMKDLVHTHLRECGIIKEKSSSA